MTPPIPDWIRGFRIDGYTNIYSLQPDETRLYGTEDLYGDWDGRVLLLAKDLACSRLVHDRVRGGDARPYRHEPELKTNRVLARFVEPLRVGATAETCGFLYGSALASLLRDDGEMSGGLPNKREAMAFGRRVLGFTLENMPRVRVVVCMGAEAWSCATGTLGVRGTAWRGSRDHGLAVRAGGVSLIGTYHPAARVSRERMEGAWGAVRNALGGLDKRAA